MRLKAACIQLTSGADVAANVAAVAALVAQAAGEGAELITLPENTFYMRDEKNPLPRYAEGEHPGVLAATELAKKHKVWILIGSIAVPLPAPEKRQYNRSLLISPEGIAATYDKIHLFDVEVGDGQTYRESERIAPGHHAVVAQTPWGGIGMTVCYDLRFPQLYRALAKAGAKILTVPSAFTYVTGTAHWHALLRARAIENGCFVLAPAQAGTHPGDRKTYGHSLIVDPWGHIMAERMESSPGIVTATLDLAAVEKVRAKIPSLEHDRDFQV